jgi:uncharacterized protein (TIGR02246 family)
MSSTMEMNARRANESGDIRVLRERWVEAFNERELDRVVSFYAEDAVELPLNGMPAMHGVSAIRELVKSMFAAGFGRLEIHQKQVGYTEPLAVELATYAISAPMGKSVTRTERGRLVATWRRADNGEFKITISVWSRELSETKTQVENSTV